MKYVDAINPCDIKVAITEETPTHVQNKQLKFLLKYCHGHYFISQQLILLFSSLHVSLIVCDEKQF